MITSRETILNKLREKKEESLPLFSLDISKYNSPFNTPTNDLTNHFKIELEKIGGKCFICNDSSALIDQFKILIEEKNITEIYCRNTDILEQLEKTKTTFVSEIEDYNKIQATVTPCDFLSARTGSVIVTSTLIQGRVDIVFPPIHIVIANESQLYPGSR
ncbi:MAG: hypothetical protein IPO21_02495 [Bacteroidales bacterium]|nr:hypothetical protein [Bacteroidales bacterium]